ncbi:hypothetical protein HNS38_19735, partial [Lentimicrobium sp. L6]|uniref:hypothetical protein n=1 Tax=Lentimicrobium sp. L6 TaxID=2735916 RepID=UPI001557B14C
MENYKELLSALYKEHAPEKLDQIDFYLDRYKGKEKQFYITQKAKYANKKSVKDSKKILEEAMARINKRKEEAKEVLQEEKEKKEAIEKKVETQPIKKQVVVPVSKAKLKEEIKEEGVKPKHITEKKALKPIEKRDIPKNKEKIEEKEINPPIIKKLEKETAVKKLKLEELPKQTPPVVFTSDEQQRLEDLKAKKSNFEEISKSLQEEEAKEEEARIKKTPVFWYFGAAAVILVALAIFIYFSYFHQSTAQKEPIHVQKVVVDTKPVNTGESKTTIVSNKETTKKTEEPKSHKESTKPKEELNKSGVKKQEPKVKPQKKEEVMPVQKKAQTKPTADRLYASDINRPAVFVGCYAVKQEVLAQKKVATLKAQNLDAHYYWIPDMDANGNSFFKIVIGPFNSAQEA